MSSAHPLCRPGPTPINAGGHLPGSLPGSRRHPQASLDVRRPVRGLSAPSGNAPGPIPMDIIRQFSAFVNVLLGNKKRGPADSTLVLCRGAMLNDPGPH